MTIRTLTALALLLAGCSSPPPVVPPEPPSKLELCKQDVLNSGEPPIEQMAGLALCERLHGTGP